MLAQLDHPWLQSDFFANQFEKWPWFKKWLQEEAWAITCGAFNPRHEGHDKFLDEIAEDARQRFGVESVLDVHLLILLTHDDKQKHPYQGMFTRGKHISEHPLTPMVWQQFGPDSSDMLVALMLMALMLMAQCNALYYVGHDQMSSSWTPQLVDLLPNHRVVLWPHQYERERLSSTAII